MLLIERKETKNNQEIAKWKIERILRWLLEFRITTPEIVSKLVNRTPRHNHAFLKAMIDNDLIKPFENAIYSKTMLLRLSVGAITWFRQNLNINIKDRIEAQIKRDFKFSQWVAHDIFLQCYIVENLDEVAYVIYSSNIDIFNELRPDALILKRRSTENDPINFLNTEANRGQMMTRSFDCFWSEFGEKDQTTSPPEACELELSLKSKARFMRVLGLYKNLLNENKLQKVTFITLTEQRRLKLFTWFNQEHWLLVEGDSNSINLTGVEEVRLSDPVRSRFKFVTLVQ